MGQVPEPVGAPQFYLLVGKVVSLRAGSYEIGSELQKAHPVASLEYGLTDGADEGIFEPLQASSQSVRRLLWGDVPVSASHALEEKRARVASSADKVCSLAQ